MSDLGWLTADEKLIAPGAVIPIDIPGIEKISVALHRAHTYIDMSRGFLKGVANQPRDMTPDEAKDWASDMKLIVEAFLDRQDTPDVGVE